MELLSAKGRAVLHRIEATEVRERAIACLTACGSALEVLDAFEIARYELLDLELPDVDVWSTAAPEVRNVLVAVCASLEMLSALFPPRAEPTAPAAPADDLEDDLIAALDAFELGDAAPRTRDGRQVDRLVEGAEDARAEVAEAVTALVGMLRQEILAFGRNLKIPAIVGDRWSLLGELQEFKAKCTQCLEAIPAAVLAPFGRWSPGELSPRYRTELDRGRQLRVALVELFDDVERASRRLEQSGAAIADEIWRETGRALEELAAKPAYRLLWPRDKRAIILFRAFLKSWPVKRELMKLRRELDGFARFLETLRAINKRPELEESDAEHLEAARAILALGLSEAVARVHVERVYGRDPALDAWLRDHQSAHEPLLLLVERALELIPGRAAFQGTSSTAMPFFS